MLLRQLLPITLASLSLLVPLPAVAQPFGQTRSRITDDVQFDRVDSSVRAHLTRAEAFLNEEQWDEAIDTFRRVLVESGGQLIERSQPQRQADEGASKHSGTNFIPVKQWIHHRLAALATDAPPALAIYRRQVDDVAKHLFEQGLTHRNEAKLRQVVDDLFCSSHGDDALAALGEMALERGDFATARHYWERISPALRYSPRQQKGEAAAFQSNGMPWWFAHRRWPDLTPDQLQASPGNAWSFPTYPDSDHNLASVRARLVLVSILEGDHQRATWELATFASLHPQATGKFFAKEMRFVDALNDLLAASSAENTDRTHRPPNIGWPTFAGSPQRNLVAGGEFDLEGEPRWVVKLGLKTETDDDAWVRSGLAPRVAERADSLLSTFPIVTANGVVLFTDQSLPPAEDFSLPKLVGRVRAFDLSTGRPKWPRRRAADTAESDTGLIYQTRPFTSWQGDRQRFGVARFSMTQQGDFAFARLGSPQTTWPKDETLVESRAALVALDLSQQGKVLWKPIEPGNGLAFEGAPLCDGQLVYIAQRGNQSPPKSYVACFDLKTGSQRWRTAISSADTPALGRREEITHTLLTLAEGMLFINTNLGSVAAVRATDGELQWLTTYTRATDDPSLAATPPTHFQRDMNPCVFWRGLVFAAPSDTAQILALDALTGQLVWSATPADVVHLLGVGQGNLLCSGHRLWWIDALTGETKSRFPQSAAAVPRGWGRGLLIGDQVLWPTREQIYVFDQQTSRQLRQPINLARRGLTGGNLAIASGTLLIATHEKIYAFTIAE